MSDADFIREVEELYLRLANADTDDLVELAKLAGLDPKTDLADSVWVPYPSFSSEHLSGGGADRLSRRTWDRGRCCGG